MKIAFKLFLKKGFTDVSINDILSEARITKGGFFYYFKSKNQLFVEVISGFLLVYTDQFVQKIHTLPGSPRDKLELYFDNLPNIEAELQKMLDDKTVSYRSFYLLLMEAVKKFDYFNERMLVYFDRLLQEIISIIDEGKREGLIKKTVDSNSIAQHIGASSEGIALLWVITKKTDLKMMSKEMFNHFWELIKA